MKDVIPDIGLSKRIAAVVVRRPLGQDDSFVEEFPKMSTVVIRGTEGMAIQMAPCCLPIRAIPSSARSARGRVWLSTARIVRGF